MQIETMATTEEVAAFLKLQPQTLRRWRIDGSGPAYVKVGNKVRYDMSEVRGWLASQTTARGPLRVEVGRMIEILELVKACGSEGESALETLGRIGDCDYSHSRWDAVLDRKGQETGVYYCRDCGVSPELAFALNCELEMEWCGHSVYTARDYELLGHHVNTQLLSEVAGTWSCSMQMDDWGDWEGDPRYAA